MSERSVATWGPLPSLCVLGMLYTITRYRDTTKDCFLPIFRYDDDVVSAIPPDMALVVPFSHCGFSFVWPWRVHTGRNHIPLHESTPERQSLCESHRQRRWLTHWSYVAHCRRSAPGRVHFITTDYGYWARGVW